MQVSVGYCDNPDSLTAGKWAAQDALSKIARADMCDFVLLFATARHNQALLREGVVGVVGNTRCIFGGGAVGIITNDTFGYAGDQVGIACIWLDGSACDVTWDNQLDEGEVEAGMRLGKALAQKGITATSPVMLFYDAIKHTNDGMRLLMATWLLEGMEKSLGFLPDLVGAGLQGDHMCTATQQYIGGKMDNHSAFTLMFSDDIHLDSVIIHGCHPASPYYTVTKAEGSMILEINGEPAISFIDKLLGPGLKPDDYPFFLLFGVNCGESQAVYDENDYVSRLCWGIDKQRGGIIMFEPDMVEGTSFQIMLRSLDLEYMRPKIESAFSMLNGREPVFAMYIDCAGRCAGYGGMDREDAIMVQEIVDKRVPLLGIYTGVEIASIKNKSRGLDWTGVFCLFSKEKDGRRTEGAQQNYVQDSIEEAARNEESIAVDEMRKICEKNAAKVLALDAQLISIRHELEQKRRGFKLLSELTVSLRQIHKEENIFIPVAKRINAALNMQRTVVLLPNAQNCFAPFVLQGYIPEDRVAIAKAQLDISEEFLKADMVLINGADDEGRHANLRKLLKLPYFISVPVVVRNEVAAILITGRTTEATPFLSRLGRNDVETVQSISALLASLLVHQRLDDANKQARTDALTGLLNRGALEEEAEKLLNEALLYKRECAFLMIDFDEFKGINDTYGHMVGDTVLKGVARVLRHNFRSTDIVARLGGDEFVVCCTMSGDKEHVYRKAKALIKNWQKTTLITEGNEVIAGTTISIGVAVAPRDGTTYKELYRKADIALYQSKHNGRNRFTVYDGETMDK